MLLHPDTLLELAHDRQRELIADAKRYSRFRRARRSAASDDRNAAAPRGRPVANLEPCGPRVAAPAR